VTWLAVLLAAAGCLALKLLGWSVPARLLAGDRLRRGTELLPVALLAGLVVVQAVGGERSLVLDARVAGLGVAALALLLRAPFLAVVVAAAATAAVLRAL